MDSVETLKEEIAKLTHRSRVLEFANETLGRYVREGQEEKAEWKVRAIQAEQEQDMAIKRMNNTIASWNEQKTEIERLNAALGAANSRDDGQYYAWMPNEENHLESLSCNVMIPAEWIRNIIDESRQQAERERDEAREKLRGVGVEEYYALQSKCREQAVTIRSLEQANTALLEGLREVYHLASEDGVHWKLDRCYTTARNLLTQYDTAPKEDKPDEIRD